MKKSTQLMLEEFLGRYPMLKKMKENIVFATEMLVNCVQSGNKVLVCGNGGSAADAQHIVGELMKGFVKKRNNKSEKRERLSAAYPEISEVLQEAVPAVSLVGEAALISAFANDNSFDFGFAQGVYGLGQKDDVFIAISTSGNSKNVVLAAKTAEALGLKIIGLTGRGGGELKDLANILFDAPGKSTYEIQEYHLPIYHVICLMTENELFD